MSLEAIGKSVNLLEDPTAWSTLSPRDNLTPKFDRADDDHGVVLISSGTGRPTVCGCWRRVLPAVVEDGVYQIEVTFEAENVENLDDSVYVMLANGEGPAKPLFAEVARAERNGKQFHFRGLYEPIKGDAESEIELQLYIVDTPNGTVRWTNATIARIEPPKPRIATFAAITGEPRGSKSVAESMGFYCERIEAVLEMNRDIDLLVLPEHIHTDCLRGNNSAFAEPIPGGDSFNRLCEYARRGSMYISTSLHERDKDNIYNTCVLIDRNGELVGKYRKIQLTNTERFIKGITPGKEWKVFETDFAKVGMLICYDNHYPESMRALAVMGAEVVVFPNAGDGREKRALWEPYMRGRAAENHVHIIAALNHGKSLIVNPRGEFDAEGDESIGDIILAECDLNRGIRDWTTRPAYRRYLQLRRPLAHQVLSESQWDLLKKS